MKAFTLWTLLLLTSGCLTGVEHLPIGSVQGAELTSPYEGKVVSTEGIVTRVYKDGFIIQSATADASRDTSEGIYIYQKNTAARTGNELRVTGKVQEWIPGGPDSHNQSLTQIRASNLRRLRNQAPLPKPVNLNHLMADFPAETNHTASSFDPSRSALDFWESMEHMRVVLTDTKVIGPRNRYGEIVVSVPGNPGHPLTPRGGVKLTGYDVNAPRIIITLPEENQTHFNTGDRITKPIHGILTYSYGNYKVKSATTGLVVSSNWIPKSEPAPEVPEHHLGIATFNVENLYPGLPDEKFRSLAGIIVQSLKSPHIVALQEIHDNSGPENDGVVDASETLKKLVDFIVRSGGPRYAFTQLNPENNADGGWPGANIRNAYLYRPEFIVLGRSYLIQDPAFASNETSHYSGTRKPLVGFFNRGSHPLILINCHLRSKGGDSPAYGSLLPPVRFSEAQRIAQSRVLRKVVDQMRADFPDAGIIVLGDLNDFEFSEAVQTLTRDQRLINLIDTVSPNDRYSYNFQGYSQVLDHILVSPELAAKANARIIHVNADLSESLRASDHDPVLAWFDLGYPGN